VQRVEYECIICGWSVTAPEMHAVRRAIVQHDYLVHDLPLPQRIRDELLGTPGRDVRR